MTNAVLAAVLLASLSGAAPTQELLESAIPNAPPLSPAEQTNVIEKARDNALQYLGNLPNFICMEAIRRYQKGKPAESWKTFDTLVLDLSYNDQGESHKLVSINGKPTRKKYVSDEVGGYVVSSNFGSALGRIFSPEAQAKFHWERWTNLRGRPSHVFAYSIEQPHSKWIMRRDKKKDTFAFRGLIYVDDATHQIMRLTEIVDSFTADWPFREAQSEIDYGYVDFDGKKFLLPIHAEDSLASRNGRASRNIVEFSNYRKFGAEATIKFQP